MTPAPTTAREHGPRYWLLVALFGITGYYVASYVNFLGLVYIDASLERILLFTYLTFVLLMNGLLMNGLLLKRRVLPLQWMALRLTYSGILLAFLPHLPNVHTQANVWLGTFWVVLKGLAPSGIRVTP